MKGKQLKVDDVCFFNRKQWLIAGAFKDHWLLYDVNQPGMIHAAMQVHKGAVEPIANTIFKVGDTVRTEHSFRGKVTGFEEAENRVICISHRDNKSKHEGGRVRYSYRVDDLEKEPERFTFSTNRYYMIDCSFMRDVQKVIALGHPEKNSTVVLYLADNGDCLGTWPETLEGPLAKYDIRSVAEVK